MYMSTNRLRFNPSKAQNIWFGIRHQLSKLDLSAIAADFPHFILSPIARDLRVTVHWTKNLLFVALELLYIGPGTNLRSTYSPPVVIYTRSTSCASFILWFAGLPPMSPLHLSVRSLQPD